jgi:hypothetical protein
MLENFKMNSARARESESEWTKLKSSILNVSNSGTKFNK